MMDQVSRWVARWRGEGRSKGIAAVLAGVACSVLLGAPSASAQEGFGVAAFDGMVTDPAGDAYTQAGGHPFEASTSFDLRTAPNDDGVPQPRGGLLRNARIDLPPGLVGNPGATPTCPLEQLMNDDLNANCDPSTIVGNAVVRFAHSSGIQEQSAPIHNLVPPPNLPARFGFVFRIGNPNVAVFLNARVRSDGEYAITIDVRDASQARTVLGTTVTLWGLPADPSHDALRCVLHAGLPPTACIGPPGTPLGPHPFDGPERAFLSNPTTCTEAGEGLVTTLRVDSWPYPGYEGESDTASFESHNPPGYPAPPEDWGAPQGPTGCDRVPFNPSIDLRPTSQEADSPTGLSVRLSVPQDGLENPDGIATAHLKRVEVNLPEGMAISPSSADGLDACSPEQIGLTGTDPIRFSGDLPTCPDASKIGTVEIETPLLPESLEGGIYLAEQENNPFGSDFAIYLVAEGRGVVIKLPGKIEPDPDTGQLVATFDDNPQLPFTNMRLRFKGGARAPLVTPQTCGTHEITTTITPWSAADPDNPAPEEVVTETDTFEITSGPNGRPCVADLAERPFEPGFTAGLLNPVAGSSSPFVLRLTRPDGDQEVLSLETSPPEGVSAVLRAAEQCAEEQAEAGDCPDAARIGTAIVGAGAGSNPYFVQGGGVFLAGPYKGAPLSLVISVPAVAGPFDLGMVAVRAAVHVDPRTAQLRVVSDEIPRIVSGVPLRARDIRIRIDKPGFMVAPTDCTETQVTGTAFGSHGAEAALSQRFQVGECRSLAFDPKLRFKVKGGRKATKRNFHPTLEARLTVPHPEGSDPYAEARPRQANVAKVVATLPRGMFLDQGNLETICTRQQYADGQCPAAARIGSAEAHSPLLAEPLAGPVYLIASDNLLPDLVADLDGIVDIDLHGRIDQRQGRIRNTFDVVPDVPVSDFRLTIDGGRNQGLLVNSRDTCRRKQLRRVNLRIFAQNGDTAHGKTQVKSACPKPKKGKKRRKRRR